MDINSADNKDIENKIRSCALCRGEWLALEQRLKNLEYQAKRDELTGLFNRRYFNEFLDCALSRGFKEDIVITLFMCDINNFKSVNDSYGYVSGDNVLKKVASILQSQIDETDIAARIGGDEFVILFVDKKTAPATNKQVPKRVVQIIENLKKLIADSAIKSYDTKHVINVNISSGISSFPTDGKTINELMDVADKRRLQSRKLK